MKRFQILLFAFILSASAFAQKEFIDKLGNIDGVTSVYVSKTMLKLLPQLDVKELDLKKISQKMDGVQILTADNLNAVKKLKTNALSYLQKNKYEQLIEVKDGKENTTIFMKQKSKDYSSFVLLSADGNQSAFTLIALSGSLTLEDIQSIR